MKTMSLLIQFKNGNGVNDKGIEPDQYIPFKSLELMEETFF